ncbi:DUF6867 family protein [Mesorhizobium sp. CAU 1732]|uniref:DUF6867 family protein n=1 Tax=Mesorhizobium sp. CAU 1732 TaxID=3140358 RepID=UPI0032604E9C
MENENTLIWEVTIWEFVFVTIILAGGAAFMTGRAIARSWLGTFHIVTYMVLLAAATRFIHFALFSGTLISLHYYVVDLIVLLAIAVLGFRMTRAKQMRRQYSFLNAGAGR